MQTQQQARGGAGPVAYVTALGLVLAVVVAAAFGIQLTRIILNNPMLTVASVGGLLVLAGVAGATVLGLVDALGDGASAYGRSLGAGRSANIEMVSDVANIRAANAKVDAAARAGVPMFIPPPPNGNGNGHGAAVNKQNASKNLQKTKKVKPGNKQQDDILSRTLEERLPTGG